MASAHRLFIGIFGLASLFLYSAISSGDRGGIAHVSMTVQGKNDEWSSSGIKAERGDLVVVHAEGIIDHGGRGDTRVDPNGCFPRAGECRVEVWGLEMKVGDISSFAGSNRVMPIVQGGTIKFRFKDDGYGDNSGAFRVTLVVIPANLLPPPSSAPED